MAHLDITALYTLYLQHPSVQTDTRKLKQGDIYFALKGPNFNGNAFAKQAIDAGAAYAVIDEAEYEFNDRYILVGDALETLQQLALQHRRQLSIPFLAITGSNGKTTTKELITSVLQQQYKVSATEGNLNNHIGVPLTILKIKKDAEIAIIEMGANHQTEIESYCRIALPGYAIITNCGKAHIEGFGGEEGVRKGKGELYDFIRENKGTIFRNTDLPYLEEMAHGIAKQILYGSSNAQYIGKPLLSDIFLKVAMLTRHTETVIDTQLVGSYNFPNCMAAIAVGLHFNLSIDKIKIALAQYAPDNSRSQWVQKGDNKIILDAYNANPTSMQAAIANFAAINLPNKLLWIGGMKEMGQDEQKEHADLITFIQKYKWDDVILVGKEFKDISGTYKWFRTSDEAAGYIKANPPVNSAILIKGSRGSRMEVLLAAL